MIAAVQDDLVHRHRLTVQEYYRMVEVGLLAADARTDSTLDLTGLFEGL
jgi:hypothetical protein